MLRSARDCVTVMPQESEVINASRSDVVTHGDRGTVTPQGRGNVTDSSDAGAPAAGAGPAWAGRHARPDRLDIASDRGELFNVWRERWEDYVLLSGLGRAEPSVQIAALRDCLTDDTVRVLRNLELSETDRIDVKKSIDALEKYANGQVNEVIERKKFNKRVQAQGESFDDFLTSLKELVRSCNFCNECRDSLIRDRVIMSLRSAETVKCLCATPDLSLLAAVSVCRAQEAASRDALELYSRAPDGPSAQQVRSPRAGGGPASCAGCGRRRHRSEQHCPARGQRCRACQGLHHFAAVCPSRMDCRWNRESRDRYQSSSPPRDRYSSPRPRGRYPSSPPRDRYPSPPPRGWYSSPPPRGRYPSSPPRDRYPSPPPRGWYSSPPPRGRYPSSPPRDRYPSPPPRGRYRPASQDRLQPRQVRFEQDDYASGRRPTASAIIASASVQGAPRIRVHVKAYEAASVEALPDTGADVSVAGLQFLDDMGEFPENLLPPDEHPKAANGEVIKSIGILPVHTTTPRSHNLESPRSHKYIFQDPESPRSHDK